MNTYFYGKQVSAMLGVLPETDINFDDEVGNYSFPEKQTLRLKKVMGYNKHSISKKESTVSDFAIYGLKYMLDNKWITKDEVGAIITVSLCPDHFVPHMSNIIHGEIGFGNEVICIDIPQGCCGFLLGLMESFCILEHSNRKIILVNGDVLSHKVSSKDRNDYPLIGDGASISIIENSNSNNKIYYEMHMDGSRRDALIIPAGGFRMPSTNETAIMNDLGDGNFRSLDNMRMDGSAVFNFVQNEVPGLIKNALELNEVSIEGIDYFLFHQPNKFMLQKLAEKIGIPFEKIPMNLVENFGNPSGASIPLVTMLNLSEELKKKKYRCCLSAFGSGLAWGTIIMDLGCLNHCEMIRSNL